MVHSYRYQSIRPSAGTGRGITVDERIRSAIPSGTYGAHLPVVDPPHEPMRLIHQPHQCLNTAIAGEANRVSDDERRPAVDVLVDGHPTDVSEWVRVALDEISRRSSST